MNEYAVPNGPIVRFWSDFGSFSNASLNESSGSRCHDDDRRGRYHR
jgi:hypothetical protein